MNRVLSIYNRLSVLPFGRYIFSRLVCFNAPYFRTIRPLFTEVLPGRCTVFMKKRRSVQNHLKSVHAIAMCNMSELAAGTMAEASLAREFRWIPRSMTVHYKKIARSNLTAHALINPDELNREQDIGIPVSVTDTKGEEVFTAVITMHISRRGK